MMQRTLCALVASAALSLGFQAVAQEGAALPKVIRVFREEIKQGREAAHVKSEASFSKMQMKYKYPAYVLGLDAAAGPSEAWFIEGHDSFESIQNADMSVEKNNAMKADFTTFESTDGELRTNSRTMLAVLRPELSYKAGQFMGMLPKMRYMSTTIVRIRPRTDIRLAELGRKAVAAYERAMLEQPVATYQVVSGGVSGMYLLFAPMQSMKSMDEAPERQRAVAQALGTEGAMAFVKAAGEVIVSEDVLLLEMNPKMSYVSKEFAAGDPDFWNPKSEPAVKPAKAKSAEKPAAPGQ